MKSNLHQIDRILRIAVGILVATLYFMGVISGPVALGFAVIAGIFIATGIINFCPLYKLMGISTKASDTKSN